MQDSLITVLASDDRRARNGLAPVDVDEEIERRMRNLS